jgi:hypothetical protein
MIEALPSVYRRCAVSSEADPPADPAATDEAGPPEADDDLHRNFRAALERKKQADHRSTEHMDARGAGPANNTTSRRMFRRKSG